MIWKNRLNPIFWMIIFWVPGVFLSFVPAEFILPDYQHLNAAPSLMTIIYIGIGLIGYSLGVLACLSCVETRGEKLNRGGILHLSDVRLSMLYFLGLGVVLYSYFRSGLVNSVNLDPTEIVASQLSLHIGPVSFLKLFVDICSIIFFAKYFESGKKIYIIPVVVAIFFQILTLQKSRVLFLSVSCFFLCVLYIENARILFWGTWSRRLVFLLAVFALMTILFLMNLLRGIGVFSFTYFDSMLFEQIYIYSGATAIRNLSATIEGIVQSTQQTWGLMLIRPISWYVIDRDLLNPALYLGGINTGTNLIFAWADFRWAGSFLTNFIMGMLIMFFLWCARRKTIIGLCLGSVAFNTMFFSFNTDFLFEPTTWILIALVLFSNLFLKASWVFSLTSKNSI